MRSLFWVWTFFGAALIGSSALATEFAQPSGRISIQVKPGGWGTARAQDIETVLASVANVLLPHFPQRASDRVVVEHGRQGPTVLFKKSSDGAYRVLLNVQDTRWDQFAYQFSHELCHIFTNFEHRDITARDYQWFEESLCEAVSLFTLNRMASSWERSPPNPGWDDYAPAFSEYAQRLLSEQHRRPPSHGSMAEWYEANREALEADPYLRQKNELLATRLLPLLENTPGSLAAIAYLNLDSAPLDKSFKAYLASWYRCCPEPYRAFVGHVLALLEGHNASDAATAALAF